MKILEGKFVLFSTDNSYRTGIITAADDSSALVQFDDMEKSGMVMPMELVCIGELHHAMCAFGRSWNIFHSRDDMAAYLAHVDPPQPTTKEVVKLVPHKRKGN